MVKQGYKQTEIGVIPEKWETVKLNDCCSFLGGGTPPKNILEYWEGTIPWVSSSDLCNNDVYSINVNRYITEKAIAMSATNKCPAGTVLVVSRVGVGKVALSTCEICTSQDFTNIIPEKHNALFLSYVLVPIMINKANEAQGTSIKGVTTEEIKQTTVIFPPIAEQQLITETLSDVDGMISSLEKLIAKKKAVKQGAMQELLTGKKRLSGFDNKWSTVKIKDIFEIHKGNGLSKEKLSDDGMHECILYGELFTRYSEIISNIVSMTDILEGLESCKYDVLMPGSTTTNGLDLATASVIMKDGVLLGGDIVILRPKFKIDTRIFGYLLSMKSKEILQHTQGITIVHLNTKSFRNMEVKIPVDFEEQKAIATILSDMDNEIEALEQKLAKTRQLKQGMMQQLLTGKIRLV